MRKVLFVLLMLFISTLLFASGETEQFFVPVIPAVQPIIENGKLPVTRDPSSDITIPKSDDVRIKDIFCDNKPISVLPEHGWVITFDMHLGQVAMRKRHKLVVASLSQTHASPLFFLETTRLLS